MTMVLSAAEKTEERGTTNLPEQTQTAAGEEVAEAVLEDFATTAGALEDSVTTVAVAIAIVEVVVASVAAVVLIAVVVVLIAVVVSIGTVTTIEATTIAEVVAIEVVVLATAVVAIIEAVALTAMATVTLEEGASTAAVTLDEVEVAVYPPSVVVFSSRQEQPLCRFRQNNQRLARMMRQPPWMLLQRRLKKNLKRKIVINKVKSHN